MAAEYSYSLAQNVAANGSILFNEAPVPCNEGLVYHRDGSGIFRLASPRIIGYKRRNCCCKRDPVAIYSVSYGGNIAVPTGGTADQIGLAIFLDGEEDPSGIMFFTPAAIGDFGNVSADVLVEVPWICGCSSVSVRNISDQAITVQGSNIVFDYKGIRYR